MPEIDVYHQVSAAGSRHVHVAWGADGTTVGEGDPANASWSTLGEAMTVHTVRNVASSAFLVTDENGAMIVDTGVPGRAPGRLLTPAGRDLARSRHAAISPAPRAATLTGTSTASGSPRVCQLDG